VLLDGNAVFHLFNTLRSHVSSLGVINAALFWISELLRRTGRLAALHKEILFAQPVPARSLLPPNLGRSIAIRALGATDPALKTLGVGPKVAAHRFSQGSICLAAFSDDVPVGIIWICRGPFIEDVIRCRFVPGPDGKGAWDLGLYIHPDFRNGLVFARLWDAANEELRRAEIKWTFSRISAFNPRSLKPHTALGGKPLGVMYVIGLGRWQLILSPLRPSLHLSLSASQQPDICLYPPSTADNRARTA